MDKRLYSENLLDHVLHSMRSLMRPRPPFLTFSHPPLRCLRHTSDPHEQCSIEKLNTFQLNSIFFRGGLGPVPRGSPAKHPAPVTESTLNLANVFIWMLQRRLNDRKPRVRGDCLRSECTPGRFHCTISNGLLGRWIRLGNELWCDFDRRPTLAHPYCEANREVGPQEHLSGVRWEICADRREENG